MNRRSSKRKSLESATSQDEELQPNKKQDTNTVTMDTVPAEKVVLKTIASDRTSKRKRSRSRDKAEKSSRKNSSNMISDNHGAQDLRENCQSSPIKEKLKPVPSSKVANLNATVTLPSNSAETCIELADQDRDSMDTQSQRIRILDEVESVPTECVEVKEKKSIRSPVKCDQELSLTGSSEKKKKSGEKRRLRRNSADRRKSKRRSSFVIGRITKQTVASSELCDAIPTTLSDEDRIKQLAKDAFEYTLDRLHEEFGDEADGFQQLATKSRHAVNEGIENMDDLFKRATAAENRTVPNPVNERRTESIERLEQYKMRLQEEIEQWDHILQENMDQAEREHNRYAEISSHPFTNEHCHLNSHQKLILDRRPDLNSMVDQLSYMKETTVLTLDKINRHVKLLSSFRESSREYIEKQTQLLVKKSATNIEDVDPRDLISNCLAFK